MPLNISIEPISCELHESYLYNMDKSKSRWLKAKIIGLSSYVGDSLTLHVIVEESGAIFSYIPLDAVRHSSSNDNLTYSYHELDYEFCHDEHMTSFSLSYLKSANNLSAAIKTENVGLIYEPAEYLFTLDWPNANRLQHFVKLINNGQFAVVPNHKLLVDSKLLKFPKYKKIRSRWN